jgi:hypothetical protein
MRRVRGIVLLLLGSILLIVSAVTLFAAHVWAFPYWIVGVFLAGAIATPAVVILRRAARMLLLGRAAFLGTVAAAVSLIVAVVVAWSTLSGRQHKLRVRTMADMRSIAAALENRAAAGKPYPAVASLEEMQAYLSPTYLRVVPLRDGWNHPFRYEWQGPAAAPDGYAVGSPGTDGIWQRPYLREYPRVVTTNFNDDIIFTNGEFVHYPDFGPHPY